MPALLAVMYCHKTLCLRCDGVPEFASGVFTSSG